MKKLKYAVILLLGLSMAMMVSCTKDPNNGGNGGNNGGGSNNYAELIVGKWKAANTVGEDDYHLLNINEGETFIFNANGLTTFPSVIAMEYEFINTPVAFEINEGNPEDPEDYSEFLENYSDYIGVEVADLENGYWLLVGGTEGRTFFVVKLTSTTLKLVVNDNQEWLVLNKI